MQQFLTAQREERYADAYALLSEDARARFTAEDFARRLKAARASVQVKDFAVLRIGDRPVIAGNRAAVSYSLTVTQTNGTALTQNETAVLLRQNNIWRIVWPPPSN